MSESRPQGFYLAVTRSGKRVLAFNCNRCHIEYIPAPETVRHCGNTIENFDGREQRLPVEARGTVGFVVIEN